MFSDFQHYQDVPWKSDFEISNEAYIENDDPQQLYENKLASLEQGLWRMEERLASGAEPVSTELWEIMVNYVRDTRALLGLEPYFFPPSI